MSGAAHVHAADADIAIAKRARASVVRIRWRDARFSRNAAVRNAIVVRADGLLVMAGAPLRPGTLTARLADGRELPAEQLAADTQTALTLLRVRAANLQPLALRSEPAERAAAPAPQRPGGARPGSDPEPAVGKPSARARPAPLRYAPVGLRLVMVTSDGSVAAGPVRSQRRHGYVRDPVTRRAVRTTGLVGAALAAVDDDAGAPLLDPAGRVAGLLVGRKAVVAPEKGEEAARAGLRLRPEPREVVAVPASVIRLVWPLLERFRRVPRAGLGIQTLEMDDALRTQLDLASGGHVVRGFDKDSPAAQNGLELYDVIVAVDGRAIPPGASLHDVLLPYRPGSPIELGIYRTGDRVRLDVRLSERR